MNNNILEKIDVLKENLYIKKGQFESAKNNKESLVKELQESVDLYNNLIYGINFLDKTAKEVRNKATKNIENLSTYVISSVYDDSMQIRIQYKEKTKSDSSERMSLHLVKTVNGEEFSTGLVDEIGGGLLETISIALMFACIKWMNYKGPIILDESYKSQSQDEKIEKIVDFLGTATDNQMIFSTHMKEIFSPIAHKIFEVSQSNGISRVEEC